MEKKSVLTLLRLVTIIALVVVAVWLVPGFVEKISIMAFVPSIAIYLVYKVFCVTLDIIRLLIKITALILMGLQLFI